jgi:hypothetical protein
MRPPHFKYNKLFSSFALTYQGKRWLLLLLLLMMMTSAVERRAAARSNKLWTRGYEHLPALR